jgi:uncharacterized protein YkwD
LEKLIIHYTNLERKYNSLPQCRPDPKLRLAALRHSHEMAAYQSLFHESQNPENKHLTDRLKNAELDLGNTIIGENLGVDYVYAIANIPYYIRKVRGQSVYIDAETGGTIPSQTYKSFSRRMVKNWMKSPGHRENLLKKNFNRIGIGIAVNDFKGIKAIYVTQNFIGPISSSVTTE